MNLRHDGFSAQRASLRLLAGVSGVLACCLQGAEFSWKQIITPGGPITRIVVGQDGSLQLEHESFASVGQFYPSTVWPADCGFFLRHNDRLVGMDYSQHETSAASSLQAIAFAPVSQIQSTDGRLVVTVMDNRNDGSGVPFKVTQCVSYCPGDSWVLVRVAVKNESSSTQTVDLFAAADVYVANEDYGYAFLSTNCQQTAVGGANSNGTFNLFAQATPWSPQPSSYQEDFYRSIWNIIGAGQHFIDTTTADYLDNGAGLEWQGVAIPAGETFNLGYYWACGALGCVAPAERREEIHIVWSGGTNMVLHWDQPGYLLQASSNSLCNWEPLPIAVTATEASVEIELHKTMLYRLALP